MIDTITLLDPLGFVVDPNKSALIPSQARVFLGFVLNSVTMTVCLTPESVTKFKTAVCHLITHTNPTIREVAQVVGIIAVSFPGIMYGPLHHRLTEGAKIEVLKQKTANFNAHMYLKNLLKASFSGGLTYSTYTDKNWKLRLAQMPQNRAGAAQLTHPPLEDFGPQKTVVIT